MDVLNNFKKLKENPLLRALGVFLWLVGFSIFLIISLITWKGSVSIDKASTIYFYIKYILLFPGIVPVIVGWYFLIFFNSAEDFFKGVFVFIPAFVVLHFFVAVVASHASEWSYVSIQMLEILCAVILLRKAKVNA